MEVIAVNGSNRAGLGKKHAKSVRREGKIPCVMYGGKEVIHFSVDFLNVRDLIYTPDFKLAEISLDGNTYKCILKDYQMHPVSEEILHIDFLRLVEGHTVKVNVPIRFKGTPAGVKEGGKLQQSLRRALIKTKPEYLVDELLVDVTSLTLGQSVRVRDIETNDNIELLNSPSVPVASVEIPRALRSASAAAEEEAGLVGGEVEEGETEGEAS